MSPEGREGREGRGEDRGEGRGAGASHGGDGGDEPPPLEVVVEGDEPPGGPFRSWGALYTTVIVYAALIVVVLWILTVMLSVETAGPPP